jgi:glucose/mannose transport system substrate-binding protein
MRALALLGLSGGAATIAAQCGVPQAAGEVAPTAAPTTAAGQLEIFSWWLDAAEMAALQALYDLYSRESPQVEIINEAIGSVAGRQARDVLEDRMLGGNPPDSFQVHLGRELIDSHAIPGRMEPLDSLYSEQGWNDLFPADLLDIASWDGQPWSVPVNIHRANVLWWNPRLFQEAGLDAPPETIDEFFTTAARLKEAGFDGMAFGEAGPGFTGSAFENILAGQLSPDQYRGLWTGQTGWYAPEVEAALLFLKEVLKNFANDDYLEVDWFGGVKRFQENRAGMLIEGDWRHGEFKADGFTDYAWAPVMGTEGIFVVLSDSFGLPLGAPHRENALNWLRVCGSKEGQEQFNRLKGSIPARIDIDPDQFDPYQQSAMADFKVDELVPSVVHGAAAKESWAGEFVETLHQFAQNLDIKQTQDNLARACEEAGACG